MSEKVKVSREVGKALESAFEVYKANPNPKNAILEHTVKGTWAEERITLHKLEPIKLAEILVKGYEIEQTPEEILLHEYQEGLRIGAGHRTHANAIKFTLDTLGLKIKGINE